MSFALGPGLTSQLGPFKTNKRDYPKVRKFPWKGGGVAAGGQAHAGHGNYEEWTNPISFPTKMNHHSLSFNSIVDVFDVNNVKKKALPGRMNSAAMLGRPAEQEQSQKMSLGLVDFKFAPEYTSEDEETEKDGGIVPQQPQPVQQESPQTIADNQIISSGRNTFQAPDYGSPDQVVPSGEIDHHAIISHTLDHPDMEMPTYRELNMIRDQPNLTIDKSEHANVQRDVSQFVPMSAVDVMNVNPLNFASDTLVIDQGGSSLKEFKPQLIVQTGTFREGKAKLVKPRKLIGKIVQTNPRKALEQPATSSRRRTSNVSMATDASMEEGFLSQPTRRRSSSSSAKGVTKKFKAGPVNETIVSKTANTHRARAKTSQAKARTADALRKVAKTSQVKNKAKKFFKEAAEKEIVKRTRKIVGKQAEATAKTLRAKLKTDQVKKTIRKEAVKKIKEGTVRRVKAKVTGLKKK